jgi:long-chain acyl-CoA synthetase
MRAEKYVAQGVAPEAGNLLQLLLRFSDSPAKVATRTKQNGRWVDTTWGSFTDEVRKVGAGLLALGVKPGDRVAIFAGTTAQWVVADLAISAARGITVPIYPSNTAEEAKYILNNSGATVLFVDNDVAEGKQAGRLSRIRQRLSDCPSVQKVVAFEGATQGDREIGLADLIKQAQVVLQNKPQLLEEAAAAISPDDPVCFIYTSGTTGEPKGVILTHGNWTYEAQAVSKIRLMEGRDSVILFLPLAHSFAQAVKAAWLVMGFELIFAESVDKLVANLAETRPSILPAVPRVFEKVYNNVVANGGSAPGVKGKLFRWAFSLFDEYVDAKIKGVEYTSVSFALAKRLVFKKVRATLDVKLGGNMRLFISGGAPLSRKIAYFFDLLGYKVLEGYGLTETSAASNVNLPDRIKIGTVGPALPGSEVKIAEDGEILIRGPGVMKGYYKNEAATAEVLESNGWFHSGDIGELDSEGFLRITDRKKDLIVTAGGKNVAPQNLEGQLKTFPMVSQAMVYGDKRQYLTTLLCVAEEPARKLLSDKGITVGEYAELSRRPEIREALQKVVDAVNADQPPYQSIKKFAIVDRDFTQEGGELTPTLKVKRKVCTLKYKALLDGMYDEKVLD